MADEAAERLRTNQVWHGMPMETWNGRAVVPAERMIATTPARPLDLPDFAVPPAHEKVILSDNLFLDWPIDFGQGQAFDFLGNLSGLGGSKDASAAWEATGYQADVAKPRGQ